MKMMKEAVEEAVIRLKEKYPAVWNYIEKGWKEYSMEVEKEGFFQIDRLKGDYAQPLKDNWEIDLDSLVTFFIEWDNISSVDWKLVRVIAIQILVDKVRK